MAIAPAVLTNSGDNTDRSALDPFITASVSPSGPVLLGLSFATDQSPTIEPPLPDHITGNGLTWTRVEDVYYKTSGLTMRARMALYKGLGTPSSGTISVYFNYVCVGCMWHVIDLPGADANDPIVGGQVASLAQSTPDGTEIAATLPNGTPNNAADRCYTLCIGQNAVSSYTPRANWTELVENAKGSPNQCIESQWRSDAFEATGSAVNNSGSAFPSGIIVVELAVAGGGGGGSPGTHTELPLVGVG